MASANPAISVVVPSHDRPVRLRWLLNALEQQTLDSNRWEVVVSHDSRGPETERLLRSHPLARAGMLRHVTLPPGSAPPGANRNAAWKLARAPLVAFSDDDCRPPSDWLAKALAAAERHPGAIVQGRTVPDPDEERRRRGPHSRSQNIMPPVPWAQACNILYPRAELERSGGFDDALHSGEDAELAWRLREHGVPYVGAPEVLTFHAVEDSLLPGRLRSIPRWSDVAAVVKRHPAARADFPLWIFWKRTHVWLPLAVVGAVRGRRRPVHSLLAVPWLVHTLPRQYGNGPRGRFRALAELPSRALIDLAEFLVLARGSAKHRTLFL
jgi:glycosyltransferase involved in cell wall biosynthesis